MNDFIVVYNDELYHHGVKGMKWGYRKSYLYDKKRGARSESASSYSGKERQRALNYDKRVREYQSKQSSGKIAAKGLLLGSSSNVRTYDMARAAGHGRVRSASKSVFDINAGTIVGNIGGMAVGNAVGAALSKKMNTNDPRVIRTVRAVSTIGGMAVGDLIGRHANKTGSNISLQQRGLMKRQAKGGQINNKKKIKK